MSNTVKMRQLMETINTSLVEDKIIVYPDGPGEPGVKIPIKNGMVGRIVAAVADENIADAEWLARILNSLPDEAFKITEGRDIYMPDQRSVYDQLLDLVEIANQNKMYDAADWLRNQLNSMNIRFDR